MIKKKVIKKTSSNEEIEVKAKALVLQGLGPGLGQNLDYGDEYEHTVGQETFCPIPYQSFTVGPVKIKTKLREGEGVEDMVIRVAKLANQIFEAEFEIKKKQFFERLGESGETK